MLGKTIELYYQMIVKRELGTPSPNMVVGMVKPAVIWRYGYVWRYQRSFEMVSL